MIKELIHDSIFLSGKSEIATKEDLQIAQDLLDTLMAHNDGCVGMVANMIGVRKCIIAFLDESGRAPTYTVILNLEIIKKMVRTTHRMVACRFLAALARASAINPSRLGSRLRRCKLASVPILAGQHRLFNTKLITVMVC